MPRAQKKPKTTTVDPALQKAYDRLLKEIDAADRDAARAGIGSTRLLAKSSTRSSS